MLGKDTTVLCLHMAKQAQGNLTPWLAMDKIKVNVLYMYITDQQYLFYITILHPGITLFVVHVHDTSVTF